MVWESSYIQLVITVSSLVDRMIHPWMNNLLSGHIWTWHKHTHLLVVTYGPLVSLAWIKLVFSGNINLSSVHTYDKTCIEISLLATGNLQMCIKSLHFWYFSLFWYMFLGLKLFLQLFCLWLVSFLWLDGLGFTKDFFLLCLFAGNFVHWYLIRLIWAAWGHLPPAWYGWQSP